VRSRIQTQPLETVNDALDQLRAGKVEGRIVLTMSQGSSVL
jgi:D-arabinose 1-dehydrogenase-like Zn-dependent alcohol dehydrogenase